MTITFPDPTSSPWTNPDDGKTYVYMDPPGAWVSDVIAPNVVAEVTPGAEDGYVRGDGSLLKNLPFFESDDENNKGFLDFTVDEAPVDVEHGDFYYNTGVGTVRDGYDPSIAQGTAVVGGEKIKYNAISGWNIMLTGGGVTLDDVCKSGNTTSESM